jgi:predicted nuclease of predicted toxin-antitoxin system
MKILLDECVDWRLSRDLLEHEVKTARQMGWATAKNGELLALASEAFDVFVTVDRKLPSQQNLNVIAIAVVVLRARINRLADLRPLVPSLLAVLPQAKRGEATVVGP